MFVNGNQWFLFVKKYIAVSLYTYHNIIIKSPRYTGGDFMFLYRFVRRRRRSRRRRRLLSARLLLNNFLDFFHFWYNCWPLPIDYLISFLGDFRRDLDLQSSRSNMEFAISQPKMVRLPRNKKQTYRLNSGPQMWPSSLTLAMTLTLNFQGQTWNLLYLREKWSDCHETKNKHIDWTQGLKCDHQVWP